MKNKSLTPQIRFKGYDDEWSKLHLKDTFTLIPFKQYVSESTLGGRFPVIQQGNSPILGYSSQNPCLDFENTLVIGDHTMSVYYPKMPFLVASDGVKILKSLLLSGEFFYYFLLRYKPVTEGYKRHFTILLEKFGFSPNIKEEERKISKFFSAIDYVIAEAEREISRLEKMKQASLQKMFPRPGGVAPEIRFGGFAESWSSDALGNLASIYQPKTISQDQLLPYGYPVYGANGMIGYYSDYNHAKPQIAITCRGNTCGTVNFTLPKSWITGNAMVVNLDNSALEKDFVYYYLQSRDMTALISGSGQPQITRRPIAEFTIIYPQDMCEQKAIGEYFRNIDSLLAEKRRKLVKLRNIKQACLNKMFVNTYDL